MIDTRLPRSPHAGFSLVEIMVGMVIGLLGILIIMQVFAISEGQKRTTTGTSDAQENGLMAMQTIERDGRNAGYGLAIKGMSCASMNTYNNSLGTPLVTGAAARGATIVDNGAASDTLEIVYSGSPTLGGLATLTVPMTSSASNLIVDTDAQLHLNDLVYLLDPNDLTKPCSRLQLTGPATLGQTGGVVTVAHAATSAYNPPTGTELFPTTGFTPQGYPVGSKLINFGAMIDHRYQITSNNLELQDLSLASTIQLANNIVYMKAQYGVDDVGADGVVDEWVPATGTWLTPAGAQIGQIQAIRIALVARSTLREKDIVTPGTSIKLWPDQTDTTVPTTTGPTYTLPTTVPAGEAGHYRYKIYTTIIPMRNLIWAH
jgi:type IV pilus assembly protein PilW